ncbi:MurR/RpiR family transcriptional regulator [Lacticaseibacillus pabuli]|uniref:MurR/RpiR family transcriptional regulator n=1 Tax=Lacticaseibacillus pabuli TaxID=3025672 RepID=A0ABY7WT59_9LACO|nr:MurR/RpiR family transcriptional regulator [Lacticaseibacillus sp. KACC 23028]WDF82340.1 MurR/RpiR family transcriptional regulator [Lacticaseibacillus sp. KACC 23028]
MTVRGNVDSVYAELSTAEKRIADYLVDKPEEVLALNGQSMADRANTSAATISRFVKHLGFSTFTEFKMQLSADLSSGVVDDQDEEIRANESLASISGKLLRNAERVLHETVAQVHPERIEKLVDKLERADRILCFGVGASYLVAQDIAQKWNRSGSFAIATDDLNQLLPLVVDEPEKCVCWFISNSGESPEAITGAAMARKAGTTVVAMTKLGDNELSRTAEIVIQTSQPTEATVRFAATQSLHAQMMLIDIVFYAYASRHFDEVKQRITESRQLVADYKQEGMQVAKRLGKQGQ